MAHDERVPGRDARPARAAPPLVPPGVDDRLNQLRALCVLESDAAARARLERERPTPSPPPFVVAVVARLRELRALDELARHLHRGRFAAADPPTRASR